MVRKRGTEKAILTGIDGPLLRRTLELIEEIEEGRRTCEVANLELLAAYQRLHERAPTLNAVITELPPQPRAPEGPLHVVGNVVLGTDVFERFLDANDLRDQGQHRRRRRRHHERLDGRRPAAGRGRRARGIAASRGGG